MWSYRDTKYRRGENKLKFLIIIILRLRTIADIRKIFLMELVKPSGILEIENKEGIWGWIEEGKDQVALNHSPVLKHPPGLAPTAD